MILVLLWKSVFRQSSSVNDAFFIPSSVAVVLQSVMPHQNFSVIFLECIFCWT